MSVIDVKELTKVFKIPKKEPGLGGAVNLGFVILPQYQLFLCVVGPLIAVAMSKGPPVSAMPRRHRG